MLIRVNLLIYCYIILSICILLFDLVYIAKRNWQNKREPEILMLYSAVLLRMIQSTGVRLLPKNEKRLARKLKNPTNLLAFHEAIVKYSNDAQYCEQMNGWILRNRELFFRIKDRYVNAGDSMLPAFYAYIIWKHKLCGKSEKDHFVILAQELCMRPSLYCRENALCAIYASGEARLVVKTYLLIARHDIIHSEKLVTDGLLQFSGDHQLLCDELWKSFYQFPVHYQLCFMNYIRMVSGRFRKHFYDLLLENQVDREVQFSAIRYMRSYPYDAAAAYLQHLVLGEDGEDWEYAAIAALSLSQYPSADTEKALAVGCRSENWYVRDNASESLLKIATMATVKSIMDAETDPYARKMLLYKFTKRQGDMQNDGLH